MSQRLFIFIGGSDQQNGDYSLVRNLAQNGRNTRWSSLKSCAPGDRVLVHIQKKGIIARAEVLAEPVKGEPGDYAYLVETGKFKLLSREIPIAEIKKLLTNWAWLRFPRRGAEVPEKYARKLWDFCLSVRPDKGEREFSERRHGAGFGSPDSNKKVEKAAVQYVARQLRRQGYSVESKEADRIGYDLLATNRNGELHVEVKGVSGPEPAFQITANEVRRARCDSKFRLAVVTEATSWRAQVRIMTGAQFGKRYRLSPMAFVASRKQRGHAVCTVSRRRPS